MSGATAIATQVFRQLWDGYTPGSASTYIAVPGDETARWLLPTGNSKIGQVLASWTPYRLRSRVAWMAIRAASQTGFVTGLPGVETVEIDGTREADWESLGWRWPTEPVPVIYLGNTRPTPESRSAPGREGDRDM